jgi:hypothetical protein
MGLKIRKWGEPPTPASKPVSENVLVKYKHILVIKNLYLLTDLCLPIDQKLLCIDYHT